MAWVAESNLSSGDQKRLWSNNPDNKVHGTIMGPIWGLQDPGGPHVGPMNLAIWVDFVRTTNVIKLSLPCVLAVHPQIDPLNTTNVSWTLSDLDTVQWWRYVNASEE